MTVDLRVCGRLTAGLVLAVALAGADACSGGASSSAAPPAATVAVAEITRGPLSRSLVITAELRPYQDVDVHAKVSGFVQSIPVDVGDRVKQGDVLATLEIPEMADDIRQADAGVGASESEVTRAEAEVTRASSAHDVAHVAAARLAGVCKSQPGLVAQQEIDEANGRDKVAEAQLATATAALAASRQQLAVSKATQARTHTLFAYARITAPFSGVITKRYADTGTMIQAGTSSTTQALPLVRLAEDDHLRLVIPVPESAVPHIHEGGSVDVRVPSLNRTFSGRDRAVLRPGGLGDADHARRSQRREPHPELVPGMYAEASVVLEQVTNALIVPAQAMDHSDEGVTVSESTPSGTLERRPSRSRSRPRTAPRSCLAWPRATSSSWGPAASCSRPTVQPQLAAPAAAGRALMSRFALRNPYFIVVVCLIIDVVGVTQRRPHAGRPVPVHQHSGRRGRDVLQRHAARSRSKPTSPAASSGSSRWAAASTTSSRGRCRASA